MVLAKEIIGLFDRNERWKLGFLALLLFFGSLLEIVGIGITRGPQKQSDG